MSIIFKPVGGSLDVSTEMSDLPESSNGKDMMSSAMARCKNLRLDRPGALVTRDGSSLVSATQVADEAGAVIDLIVEQGGVRYEFLSNNVIFKDETAISKGVKVATPTFLPAEGVYSAAQTVVISCTTIGATIYYTIDGTTPSASNGFEYIEAVLLPDVCRLKARAIKSGYVNSAVASGFYSVTDMQVITEINSNSIITETDSNSVISEGV